MVRHGTPRRVKSCRVCRGELGAVVPLHDSNVCMRCHMAQAMGEEYPPPHLATMASRMRPNPCTAPAVVRVLYKDDRKVVLCTWHAQAGRTPVLRPDRLVFDDEDQAVDAVEMEPGSTIKRFGRFDNDPPDVLCSWL